MTIETKGFQDAYARYRADLAKAATWVHPDYSDSGITRERARQVEAARAKFEAAIPPAPTGTRTDIASQRSEVLQTLTSAEREAQDREWATVQAMLQSGRLIEEAIYGTSDPVRLAAIAANAEAFSYGQKDSNPVALASHIQGKVFDRLADVGYAPAQQVHDGQSHVAAQAAWHSAMTEALNGTRSPRTLSTLFEHDPEGFQAISLADGTSDPDGQIQRTVDRLHNMVATGEVNISAAAV